MRGTEKAGDGIVGQGPRNRLGQRYCNGPILVPFHSLAQVLLCLIRDPSENSAK